MIRPLAFLALAVAAVPAAYTVAAVVTCWWFEKVYLPGQP